MNDTSSGDVNIHTLAGVVLLMVSPLGVIANLYVFVSVLRRRQTRTSFLTLCASKALFNLVTCLVFLFWCTPTALIHSHYLPPVVGVILGDVIGGMIYLGGVLTQVLASVNRLIASFSIHVYNRFCTLRHTLVLVFLTWIGTLSLAIVYFLNGVGYLFHEEMLIWQSDGQQKSDDTFRDLGLVVYTSTAAMFILNTATFLKLIMLTKSNTVLSNTESTKRMKRNRVLFAQKVSQDCLYLVDMLFAQVLSGLFPYNWWQLLCFTFIWITLNTLDGFVMIIFVKDLYDPIRRQYRQIIKYFFPDLQPTNELFKRRQSKAMTTTSSS